MMVKFVAVFLAAILAVSAVAGSFYLAGAQQTGQPELTLGSAQASASSVVDASGSNFAPNSEVSIYLMTAAEADLENGSATILQEIANTTTTESVGDEQTGSILDSAIDAIRNALGLEDQDGGTATSSEGTLLIVFDGVNSGSLTVECDDENVAEGNITSNLVVLEATAGSYDECSISVSDGNTIVDAGSIGSLGIAADSDIEDSKIGSATADGQGAFEASLTIPEVDDGDYAVLAVGNDSAAIAELSVAAQAAPAAPLNTTDSSDNATGNNVTSDANITTTTNDTTTVLPDTTTQANQTQNATGEANVEVEQSTEPGSPLAISGEGFQPNTPVQVLINNVQITNIITNVQGSFNTVVIVPTTVNAGNAEVSVKTEQTNIIKNVNVVQTDGQNQGPATVRFTAVSATDNAQALEDAPVTVFDTRNGRIVDSGDSPMEVELDAGTYSVFYADFEDFDFQEGEPGRWTDTPDGGSGLITVKAGRNMTVTAMYAEEEQPAPAPARQPDNSLTLRAVDTDGQALQGMFVTVYNVDGEKIQQGFTQMVVDDLRPGTYPIFFANFNNLAFVSASPGNWVQTPFGGAGLVTIPEGSQGRNVVVTAVYDRTTAPAADEFNIEAPLDIRGDIFTITSNETRPEGPFVMSGSFRLQAPEEDSARLNAYFISVREDSNENVVLDSQRSRDHDTFQIVDLKTDIARPVGPESFVVSGTADLLLNGDMYSNDEPVHITVRGGEELSPTNVEIEFQGDHRYSAANRLETLYGVVSQGFQ